jgi:hypothetical protein
MICIFTGKAGSSPNYWLIRDSGAVEKPYLVFVDVG